MGWDEEAAGWNDDPAVRAYSAAAWDSLRQLLAARDLALDGVQALDFGCGTGLLTERLVGAGATVTALDLSPAMIAVVKAKALPGVQALAGPLEDHVATLRQTPLSLVVASSVCSFLTDYPGTVGTLASLLAPGGLFVQWDWEENDEAAKPNGLSRAAISAALSGAGLTDITVDIGFEATFSGFVMAPLRGVGRRTG